jgi:hypothetical protein
MHGFVLNKQDRDTLATLKETPRQESTVEGAKKARLVDQVAVECNVGRGGFSSYSELFANT